ncbi:hypothetical protein BIFGAL_02805 [Bifidobacterium gallicum DSM 20093 = LMG 11596]|uniref:Uncharacterized protein n=1 Tax=Bifidobacterium gallicum DSM 20093 = LMG 11596 TaxID=561180 RepID=D1NSP6_9BIFI|nr:hypothetical protein BIFGAL_02805 [Bifidobacterium gallicum DSM 20093 = LMG 11596]
MADISGCNYSARNYVNMQCSRNKLFQSFAMIWPRESNSI